MINKLIRNQELIIQLNNVYKVNKIQAKKLMNQKIIVHL